MKAATIVLREKSDNCNSSATPSKNVLDYRNYQMRFQAIPLEATSVEVYTLL
jgi:hypothetical protein